MSKTAHEDLRFAVLTSVTFILLSTTQITIAIFYASISVASIKLRHNSTEIEYFHQFSSFHRFIDRDKNFLCSCEHNALITSQREIR